MTNQELYDMVRERMNAQGQASLDDSGSACAYRGVCGMACAVGCLIKDEFYTFELEGLSVHMRRVQAAVELSLGCTLTKEQGRLLGHLQDLHDVTWMEEGGDFPELDDDRKRFFGIK